MEKNKTKIKYADLYGLRKEKFEFLKSHSVKNTKWQNLEIEKFEREFKKTRWAKKYSGGFYFFSPKMETNIIAYGNFLGVDEIFEFYNVGGKPGDDAILVDRNVNDLKVKINQFVQLLKFDKNKARTEADKNLLKIIDEFEFDEKNVIQYNYRPFDTQYTYYDKKIYTRPVPKLKMQFDEENICLLTTKIVTSHPFQHAFISEIFPDVIFLSNRGSTNAYVFPLYFYNQDTEQKNCSVAMFDKLDKPTKRSNIKNEILEMLKAKYQKAIKPEEIFNYIYAVLYSNRYRKKYQEFLKIDFPRIPFAKDYKLFKKLDKIGKELIDLHLLKNRKLKKTTAKFCGTGLNKIEKREYNKKEKRLYISEDQYFENIGLEVWEYYIGGYQVLDKWIKDRIGKNLSAEEAGHYLKIIESLQQTIEAQKKIDGLFLKL